MIIKNPKFEISAVSEKQYPKSEIPEIVLVGKSNVGKSSFINTMLGRKSLARTSSEPGKTRQINFYNMDNKFYFVDLPGYGYAKASKVEVDSWQSLLEPYLLNNETLQELVIYQHQVSDNTNHHAIIKELYSHNLSNEELTNLIQDNLNDVDFISKLYQNIVNELTKDLIVNLIVANHELRKQYQSLIKQAPYNFIFAMAKNNYWIEDVYNLTGEQGANFYLEQIPNSDLLLNELSNIQIYSPKLQTLIINHFDFDYVKLHFYLKNSEQENKLISLFQNWNELQTNHKPTTNQVNELQKNLDLLQPEFQLTCLAKLQTNLQAFINDHHLDLKQDLKLKIKQLASENKSLLEDKI